MFLEWIIELKNFIYLGSNVENFLQVHLVFEQKLYFKNKHTKRNNYTLVKTFWESSSLFKSITFSSLSVEKRFCLRSY